MIEVNVVVSKYIHTHNDIYITTVYQPSCRLWSILHIWTEDTVWIFSPCSRFIDQVHLYYQGYCPKMSTVSMYIAERTSVDAAVIPAVRIASSLQCSLNACMLISGPNVLHVTTYSSIQD